VVRILCAAVEARYLAVNPCSIRGAASDGTSEMRIATVEQVATIADRMPSRYKALVLVAAFSRLRWEELVGLRRKRIDLEAGTVTVDEQLVEVNGTFSVGPPKSAAGRRTVLRVHDLCLPPAPWPPPPTARYARPCTGWATPQP
jgi:integrase